MTFSTLFKNRRNQLLMLAAISVIPLTAASPPLVSEPWTDTAPQPRNQAMLKAVMMKGHNDARRAVKVAPLVWNAQLAADAGAYASEMARSGSFEHSDVPDGTEPEGENLWMGTDGAFDYASMIGAWTDERGAYDAGTGSFHDTGHYTQVIWRGTTEVGCAVSKDPNYEYLVCRYLPAGNVEDSNPLDWDN